MSVIFDAVLEIYTTSHAIITRTIV